MQKGNIPLLLERGYKITYLVYTKPEDEVSVREIVGRYGMDGVSYTVVPSSDCRRRYLVDITNYSVVNGLPLFIANPDIFIGDGSLSNLMVYNTKRSNICLAALHVRVDMKTFMEWLDKVEGDISNPVLVTHSMTMLSQSWRDAYVDKGRNCSWSAGAAMQKIGDKLWIVNFRIPNVFLARMSRADYNYFSVNYDLGCYDHSWPEHLVRDKRFKYIGSSDVFYAVEMTSPQNNTSPLRDNDLWNDEASNNMLHSETNRNFLSVVRGE